MWKIRELTTVSVEPVTLLCKYCASGLNLFSFKLNFTYLCICGVPFLSDRALDACVFYLLVFFEGSLGSTEVYLQLFPPVLLLSQTSL